MKSHHRRFRNIRIPQTESLLDELNSPDFTEKATVVYIGTYQMPGYRPNGEWDPIDYWEIIVDEGPQTHGVFALLKSILFIIAVYVAARAAYDNFWSIINGVSTFLFTVVYIPWLLILKQFGK